MVDNPNAFPSQMIPEWSEGAPGISLRDWLAGQAIGAVIKAMQSSLISDHPEAGGGLKGFAATAYDIADAMLAARAGGAFDA